jgi:hypothetical protein
MNDLAAAFAALGDSIAALPQRHALPLESARPTHKAMLAITQGHDPPPAMPRRDRLDEVWATLRQTARAGEGWDDLPGGVLRDAAWLLWDPRRAAADLPGLFDAIMEQAAARSGTLRRVIEAWLRDFDPANPTVAAAGRRIATALRGQASGALGRWRDAHATYGLFDAADGPSRIAEVLLGRTSLALLAELRFDEPSRATGEYMRSVAAAFNQALPQLMRRGDARALAAVAAEFHAPGGALRFDEPAANGAMADAMVEAWSGGQGPDVARPDILAFLRHHIGDPRVRPARWAQAKSGTQAIVRAWLAQLTLDAFFGVIGQCAGQAGMGHQWEARRKFWLACLRKGWISDSWLVLGGNVRDMIRANRDLQESYGTLYRPPNENHSVLLMRIGGLLFAEWSHNGKVRAWPIGSPNAPRLPLGGSYEAESLRTPCIAFPPPDNRPNLPTTDTGGVTHHQDVWQGRVAALLRRQEGLRLSPMDYR